MQPYKDSDVLSSKHNAHACSIQGNLSYNSKRFQYADNSTDTDNKTLSSYTSKQRDTVNNESNNHSVPQSFAVKTYKHVHKEDNYEESVDTEKIPLYVWKNKHLSKDHIACLTQNGGDFGYIPLNDLL